jgi:hypothetical protein
VPPDFIAERSAVNTWSVLFWTLAAVGGLGGLYALHRLALWMEERGYLYYLHKKPSSSAASCFVAFQQVIEPKVEHVIHVSRVNHLHGEEGASGQGGLDLADAPGSGPDGVSPNR